MEAISDEMEANFRVGLALLEVEKAESDAGGESRSIGSEI